MNTRHSSGFLHWAFPVMIALVAADVIFSNRDLTQSFAELESLAQPVRPAIMVWLQRAVSIFLLLASVEQIVNHMHLGQRVPSAALLGAFVVYWMGTVGSPMLFGFIPKPSHEYMYSLVVGIAVCLCDADERDKCIHRARDALFVLMLGGLVLIPIRTAMVLDLGYGQGVIPGLPRFGGLTPHPVTQGMLAQLALLLLWCNPYERRWLNRAAWALGLGVLFLAQSKTTWIAVSVAISAMWLVRNGGRFWSRMSDPHRNGFGIVMLMLLMVGVLCVGSWMLLGDPAGRAEDFASSAQGAQLISMTGRDRIWAAALEEWRNNQVFGYGLSLWDATYRAAIGMPNATHAHNQFLDDLAKSGSIGATTLVIYGLVLLYMSLRYARATGGLSLGLFVGLALRAISEVPLSLMGYGTEFFTQLLLLVTLAAAASQRRAPVAARAPLRFGVAS